MFHNILIRKMRQYISVPLTGGSWSRSATVITERPANAFSGIITNIYLQYLSP